jgi:3-dehydroquinate synthase
VAGLLERLGFRLWHPLLAEHDAHGRRVVLAGLEEFREHLGGRLTITLLEGVGTGVEVNAMDDALVGRAIDWLAAREAA